MKFNFVGVKFDQFAHLKKNHHKKRERWGTGCHKFFNLQATEIAMPPCMQQISDNFKRNKDQFEVFKKHEDHIFAWIGL